MLVFQKSRYSDLKRCIIIGIFVSVTKIYMRLPERYVRSGQDFLCPII